jgi:hypothetical protein
MINWLQKQGGYTSNGKKILINNKKFRINMARKI